MSEIGTFIRGKRFVRTDIVNDGVPCIHYGDMYTYYGLYATESKGMLRNELAPKMRYAQKNDVVIVAAGENKEDIGIGMAWLGLAMNQPQFMMLVSYSRVIYILNMFLIICEQSTITNKSLNMFQRVRYVQFLQRV